MPYFPSFGQAPKGEVACSLAVKFANIGIPIFTPVLQCCRYAELASTATIKTDHGFTVDAFYIRTLTHTIRHGSNFHEAVTARCCFPHSEGSVHQVCKSLYVGAALSASGACNRSHNLHMLRLKCSSRGF